MTCYIGFNKNIKPNLTPKQRELITQALRLLEIKKLQELDRYKNDDDKLYYTQEIAYIQMLYKDLEK